MKAWLSRVSLRIAAIYLAVTAGISILYLAFFVPTMIVTQFLKWFNVWHVDEHAMDQGIMVSIMLTTFLLVLRVAHDVDEIKSHISSASLGPKVP